MNLILKMVNNFSFSLVFSYKSINLKEAQKIVQIIKPTFRSAHIYHFSICHSDRFWHVFAQVCESRCFVLLRFGQG